MSTPAVEIRKVGVTLRLDYTCLCGHEGIEARTQSFTPNHDHPADEHMAVYSSHPQCPECGRMHDVYFGVQVLAQEHAPDYGSVLDDESRDRQETPAA